MWNVITHPCPNFVAQLNPDKVRTWMCNCIRLCYVDAWPNHDDVMKWKHFPRYWPFIRGIHWSPVDSPHKVHLRGALIFSLICAWTNGCANNRDTGDLRRHGAHCDVIVMYNLRKRGCWCSTEYWYNTQYQTHVWMLIIIHDFWKYDRFLLLFPNHLINNDHTFL